MKNAILSIVHIPVVQIAPLIRTSRADKGRYRHNRRADSLSQGRQ